jgi:hypothetical protein
MSGERLTEAPVVYGALKSLKRRFNFSFPLVLF